jgi:hypothetical protein
LAPVPIGCIQIDGALRIDAYDRIAVEWLLVDKIGEGERSLNLADAVVMAFAPRQMPLNISPEALAAFWRRPASSHSR